MMQEFNPDRPLGVGNSWGRTLVVRQSPTMAHDKGDILIGLIDTRELAELVAEAVNQARDASDEFRFRLATAVRRRHALLGIQG